MKEPKLVNLIRECLKEVLAEDMNQVQSAKNREKQTKQDYLKAKKSVIDTEMSDLQQQSSSTNDLDEMARIPTVYSLADDIDPNQYTGTIKQIATYLKDHPGSTKIEIANGTGKSAQQAVNMIVLKMEQEGIVTSGGLKSEPKYKASPGLGSGMRGRKETPEGAKKRAAKSVYNKLMSGKEDEITQEEDDLLGPKEMDFIKAYVAKGGTKRGRPAGTGKTIDTPVPDISADQTSIDSSTDGYFNGGADSEDEPFDYDKDLGAVHAIDDETGELERLIKIKDNLLSQLKNKKIDIKTFKREMGDIPDKIKALKAGTVPANDDDDDIFESIGRFQQLANIKK